MPEKYRRYFLKDREVKELLKKVSEKLGFNMERIFNDRTSMERVETENAEIFLINGKPLLAKNGENIFPTLAFNEFFASSPKAVVDMGALPYVCKGANVMAPGITCFVGEFKKGGFVFVVDEKYGKPIALGESLYDSDAAKEVEQGAVLINIHFVGDKIWGLLKVFAPSSSK
mgnify:CR=1 FL=1